MSNLKQIPDFSASDIYYRILQIGANAPEEGVLYSEIKNQLQKERLLSNSQNTEHIQQWFVWAFEHKEFGCLCPRREKEDCGCRGDEDECDNYDHENTCKYFLRKDALIDFAQLEQSRKSYQQVELLETQIKASGQNSIDAKQQSSNALKWAIGALIISALMGIPDWWNTIYHSSGTEIKTSILQQSNKVDELLLEMKKTNQSFDTVLDNPTTFQSDSIYLRTIERTLKSINYKL